MIICILPELFFAFRTDWFFLLGTDFFAKERKKVSDKSLIIFSSVFIEYVQWKHIFKKKTLRFTYPVLKEQNRLLLFVIRVQKRTDTTSLFVLYFCVANLRSRIFTLE